METCFERIGWKNGSMNTCKNGTSNDLLRGMGEIEPEHKRLFCPGGTYIGCSGGNERQKI